LGSLDAHVITLTLLYKTFEMVALQNGRLTPSGIGNIMCKHVELFITL